MITDLRIPYKPFEYEQAYAFDKLQQRAHWLPDELPFASDINDFKMKLSDAERNLIGNILKSFAQTETHVEDYWSTKVVKWFPKHEIKGMAITFASFENIHAEAYSLLNDNLGLTNFSAFLEDETAKAKLERLQETKDETLSDIAQSLAIFSAFTEGVNLFSSFAILMSFQLRNTMKSMGLIVEWSVRDESLHSKAGCWLFNQLTEEFPELRTKDLEEKIYEACKLSIKLEIDFINKAFEAGDVLGINKEQLINFIKARANEKLVELKYKPLYEVDKDLLKQMEWFGNLTSGKSQTDFFALRPSDYSKTDAKWAEQAWDQI